MQRTADWMYACVIGRDMNKRGERNVIRSEMRRMTYQTGGGAQPRERRAVTNTLGNQDTRHSQPS